MAEFCGRRELFLQCGVQRDYTYRMDWSGFNGPSVGVAVFHRTEALWAGPCQRKFDPQARHGRRFEDCLDGALVLSPNRPAGSD
jgi:hypothetical protein